MATVTLKLPVPLTPTQITNQGALLVTVLNNLTTYQTNKTSALNALNTQLTTAQAQIQSDIAGDSQVLARDILTVNAIQAEIISATLDFDAKIATANKNSATLAKDLAVGYSVNPIVCTVDVNGIVTRTDSGTIVSWMRIFPPPKN
jgi:hypothetical protein